MKNHSIRIFTGIAATFFLGVALLRAVPVEWTVASGGNGHFYEAFSTTGISWDAAQAAATSSGGYLATILSPAENAFVFSLIDNPIYWFNDPANHSDGPWIGGFQANGSPEPAGGWQWVNNDGPFVYADWSAGNPSNSGGGEAYAQFFGLGLNDRQPTWNDNDNGLPPNDVIRGYVVETVPEPSILGLLGFGLAGLVAMHRRYRNSVA